MVLTDAIGLVLLFAAGHSWVRQPKSCFDGLTRKRLRGNDEALMSCSFTRRSYARYAAHVFDAHRAAAQSPPSRSEIISAAWFGKRIALLELQHDLEPTTGRGARQALLPVLARMVKRGVELQARSVVLLVWNFYDDHFTSLYHPDLLLGQPLSGIGIECIDTVGISRTGARISERGRICPRTIDHEALQ